MKATDAAVGPLAGVVKVALTKDRDRRFRTAAAMHAAWRASFTPRGDEKATIARLVQAPETAPARRA